MAEIKNADHVTLANALGTEFSSLVCFYRSRINFLRSDQGNWNNIQLGKALGAYRPFSLAQYHVIDTGQGFCCQL